MDVVSLSSSNCIGLSAVYTYDKTLHFDQNIYFTENGVNFPIANILKQLNDNTINNFSSLFLTNKQPLTSALYVEDLAPIRDEGFSTYIATNALNGINPTSRFLVVQEPPIAVNTAVCKMTGTREFTDNRYMFDIQFINDRWCKVSHENDNVTRYLTVDYLGALSFAKDSQTDYLGDLSPQIFYYVYDRESDVIVFLKNVNDIAKYVVYNAQVQSIALGDPLTAADIPYITRAIFRCTPRPDSSNNTNLYDSWVSYDKNLKTNTQDINLFRSYQSVPGNLLLNNEYYSVTGSNLPVNVLSLKNTSTPENHQTRGNPFQRNRSRYLGESEVEMREYKRLFTGSNQLYGNDNITLGYEGYTTDIILKKDKITYFHIPQNIYPYIQININDSGLIEAGAIPGDHPLKSDKIFKKLGSYKYTSNFGNVVDEATGNFLCSWLSGNWDINVKPIWVDRYYNPSQISFFTALSADPFQHIKYTTVSDCLFSEVKDILGRVDVFDKPSDLVFEPGAYYAYYHFGPSQVEKYLTSLDSQQIQKNFNTFLQLNDLPVLPYNTQPDEYVFDGTRYTITDSLSSIEKSGEFTLSFWAKSDDWSKPFGDLIIGNYANDGFGIFNENVTTPLLYVNSLTGAYVLNTDLKLIKTIIYDKEAEATAVIKLDNITNYYVMFNTGFIKKFNPADAEIQNVYSEPLKGYKAHDFFNTTIYVLCSATSTPDENMVMRINIPSLSITEQTPAMLFQNTYRCAYDPSGSFPWNGFDKEQKFDSATTIDFYDDYLYFTPGLVSRRVNDTIYYLKDDQTIVKWDNIKLSTTAPISTAFKSYSKIEDFNFDFEGNMWVLANDNTYYKFTQDREFLLSGATTNPNFSNYKVSFIADFFDGMYSQRALIAQRGSIEVKPSIYQTFDYDITASTQYQSSSAIPAAYFTTSPTLSVIFDNGVGEGQTIPTNIYYSIISFNPSLNQYFYQIPGFDTFITNNTDTVEANIYQPASAAGLLFNIVDMENGSILKRSAMYSLTSFNFDPTNSEYLRKFVANKYKSPNMNIKATMTNIFDEYQTNTVEIIYSLSAVDPGYHNFVIRADTYEGYITAFIDGQKIGMVRFEPRKYQFNNFNDRPFLVGTANFINSIPLFKYIKKNASMVTGLTIKDFRIYNRALRDADIAILSKENMNIQDIVFTVPAGKRNYLEEIERYFKARIPGQKSTLYNLIIKNSGITDENLRIAFEQRLIERLRELSPVYTKLNKIKWIK